MKKTGSEINRRTGPAQKVPSAVSLKNAHAPEKSIAKPHRLRPAMRALLEINKFQRRTALLTKSLLFERFVRDIAQDYMAAARFRPDAIDGLKLLLKITWSKYLKIRTQFVFTRSDKQNRCEICNLRVEFVVKLIRIALHSINFYLL